MVINYEEVLFIKMSLEVVLGASSVPRIPILRAELHSECGAFQNQTSIPWLLTGVRPLDSKTIVCMRKTDLELLQEF